MTNPTQAQIDKLTTNLGRWDDIVNGSETDTVTLDNSTVKTVSGYLAELKAYNSLGAWQTAYSYAVKDVVSESSVLYVCLVAHTSGTFSTDLSGGKWAILQTDFQNLNVSGTFSGTFSGTLTGDVTGDVTGNVTGTATNATHVTVVDNEAENENNLIPFIEDATATGNVGLESDGDFHYNPSTGTLTATLLSGTLTTASQPNITSVGTLSTLDVSGDVTVDTSLFFIDSTNGRVGLGTTSPTGTNTSLYDDATLHIHQPNTGARGAQIHLTNASTGALSSDGCHISLYYSDMYIVNQENGPIRFYTNSAERLQLTDTGDLNLGNASTSSDGVILYRTGEQYHYQNGTNSSNTVRFYRNVDSSAALVGSITTSGSSTSYNTSSDYRLKENVSPIIDGISRLMQLKPSKFNFINIPKNKVDGFLAHEVQEIIPEAVTGEKDAVDEEGNPEYQSIDQSKIVPLLVASVKELKTELDALKNK